MSASSQEITMGLAVTSDTLGAFVRPWAVVSGEWNARGQAAVKQSYVTPILAECAADARITAMSGRVELAGPPDRRGIVPVAYPRKLPADRAGSALRLALHMTHASTVCSAKALVAAIADTEDYPAFMTMLTVVAGARMGVIEAFGSTPGSQNSDTAARYAVEYYASAGRVVVRSSGATAAEDLWLSAFQARRHAESVILPALDLSRQYGPLFALVYAMIAGPAASAIMAELMSHNIWAKFSAALKALATSEDVFAPDAEWVRRAVIFEVGRWLPSRAVWAIARDPAVAIACMRRSLTDSAEIAASLEQEAHVRMTATVASVDLRGAQLSAIRSPSVETELSPDSDEVAVGDIFTSPTPMPTDERQLVEQFAFPAVPNRLAMPVPTHPSTRYDTPARRPPQIQAPHAQAFRSFAQHAMTHADPVPEDEYPAVRTPPAIW